MTAAPLTPFALSPRIGRQGHPRNRARLMAKPRRGDGLTGDKNNCIMNVYQAFFDIVNRAKNTLAGGVDPP
jgi:hypothetical protein